jgi:Methyltransferase domain
MNLLPYEIERPLQGLRFRLSRRLVDWTPTAVWPGVESVSVMIRPFLGQFGNVSHYELMVLCGVLRHVRAQTVFEFGTFDGRTTWHLAANGGAALRLWTLDLPLDHPARQTPRHDRRVGKIQGVVVGHQFHGTPEGDRIEQLYVDSLEFDPQPYRELVDFCFIDASHDYVHVSRDTENALVMVKPGGVIFWHDYSRWWPGVQKCLDDLSLRLPVFRVAGTSLAALRVPHPD